MKKNTIKNEDRANYCVPHTEKKGDDKVIEQALAILDARIKHGDALVSPDDTRAYLKIQLDGELAEKFCCLFMDNRNRVITFETLFKGTIDGASVYPREVVRACLSHNAAAVIFAHNHPSGVAEPSRADEQITIRLKSALELIDVRVLDHIIVGDECVSMAERGLI